MKMIAPALTTDALLGGSDEAMDGGSVTKLSYALPTQRNNFKSETKF